MKLTDAIKSALSKKKGQAHPESQDTPTVETRAKKTGPAVITGNKPQKKVTGRGR